MVRACILGFGGIAQAHKAAYENLEKLGIVRLVGVCDIDPGQFTRHVEINIASNASTETSYTCYTDLDEMLEREHPDVVDICLPSFLHADMAVAILRKGYHVQSEKPMALHYVDCKRMLEAARESGKQLMIGQCLHFYSQYDFVKQAVEDGRFGKVLTAFFERLSAPPRWAWENWYQDYERSGGALTDFHIHDVDMVRYLFGEPRAVSCMAQSSVTKYASCFTAFHYDDQKPVTAVGDWALTGRQFSMGYRICFEKAMVEFADGVVTVTPTDGSPAWKPELRIRDGIEGEIEYFAKAISQGVENQINRPESAAQTIRLIEAMRESAAQGGVPVEFHPEGLL